MHPDRSFHLSTQMACNLHMRIWRGRGYVCRMEIILTLSLTLFFTEGTQSPVNVVIHGISFPWSLPPPLYCLREVAQILLPLRLLSGVPIRELEVEVHQQQTSFLSRPCHVLAICWAYSMLKTAINACVQSTLHCHSASSLHDLDPVPVASYPGSSCPWVSAMEAAMRAIKMWAVFLDPC